MRDQEIIKRELRNQLVEMMNNMNIRQIPINIERRDYKYNKSIWFKIRNDEIQTGLDVSFLLSDPNCFEKLLNLYKAFIMELDPKIFMFNANSNEIILQATAEQRRRSE